MTFRFNSILRCMCEKHFIHQRKLIFTFPSLTTQKSWSCYECSNEYKISVHNSCRLKPSQLLQERYSFLFAKLLLKQEVILSISRDTSPGHRCKHLRLGFIMSCRLPSLRQHRGTGTELGAAGCSSSGRHSKCFYLHSLI